MSNEFIGYIGAVYIGALFSSLLLASKMYPVGRPPPSWVIGFVQLLPAVLGLAVFVIVIVATWFGANTK